MMKGGFQVVHGALDMIQPHEPWDNNNNNNCTSSAGFPAATVIPSSTAFPKPTAMEARCLNFERNELSEWVEHVTRQLIDDMPESNTTTDTLQPDTTMLYEDNLIPSRFGNLNHKKPSRLNLFYQDHDTEEINVIHWNSNHQLLDNSPTNTHENDQASLTLISLLLESAVAISVDNLGEAHRMLLELTQMASPYGASCAERVVAYFAKAMSSRVVNSWLGICSPLINHRSVHAAFQVFNNISPFVKFAHFTSNQAILEAFHGRDRVHIVDLDIMQGLQWPALFHILATRAEGPPHVRMTGMGSSLEILLETGKQLSNFAKRLGLSFEFQPIAKKFGEIDASMIHVRRGEAVAVHWLQHSLYDATGPDWKTMRLLQQLSPRIITLVEPEMSLGGSFLDRFVGSLHFYSTLFDSLGAYLPCDDPGRHRVEHCLFYREINNILAIGGPARSGEEKFRSWRSELARSGFAQVPMSSNSMAQAQLILNMFPPAHGYSLGQGDGTLRLGWKETSLFSASAWTSHVAR